MYSKKQYSNNLYHARTPELYAFPDCWIHGKKKQLFGLFGACLSPCLAMLNFCQSDKTRKKSVPTSTGDPEDSNIFRARS